MAGYSRLARVTLQTHAGDLPARCDPLLPLARRKGFDAQGSAGALVRQCLRVLHAVVRPKGSWRDTRLAEQLFAPVIGCGPLCTCGGVTGVPTRVRALKPVPLRVPLPIASHCHPGVSRGTDETL